MTNYSRGINTLLCQELIDIIVDYNHNDRATLINCGLTSHKFVPSSRFHLFRRLRLEIKFEFDIVLRSWTPGPFFDLLTSPLSTITRVHFVELDFGPTRFTIGCAGHRPGLFSILERLQGLPLHSLSLANVQECDVDFDCKLTGFVDLKKLIVTHSIFITPAKMFKIFSMFNNLEHLFLYQIDHYNSDVAQTSTDDHPHNMAARDSTQPSSRTLELHANKLYGSIGASAGLWLTIQPDSISTLRTVALTGLVPGDWQPIGDFLQALGAGLEYLEFSPAMVMPRAEDDMVKCLDLSFNTNLQYIHLILPDSTDIFGRVLNCYTCILSQIKSTSLREVILSRVPGMESQLTDSDIKFLPAVVSQLKGELFTQMQRIVFPPFGGDLYERMMKTELSEWNDKGLLVFEDIRGYFGSGDDW